MKNRIVRAIMLFILLMLGMEYFPYIPIYFFKINYISLSTNYKIIYTLICDLLYMLIIFLIYHEELIVKFKEYIKKFKDNFTTSFGYYFAGMILMVVSNIIISVLFKEANANNEVMIREYLRLFPIYMIFEVSIVAPFIEEMIFRKCIYDIFKAISDKRIFKYIFVFVSGFVFALLHVLGTDAKAIDYIYVIPYFWLAISFAALYCKTDNIFNTISMHFLHNTIIVLLYYIGGVI